MSCNAHPQREHEWLQRLVGEWTFEAKAAMSPDDPSMDSTGRETVRSLGGLWIIGEGSGEMTGGGVARMVLTLGYDPAKGRFVGSWIGSMMAQMFVYDGRLDEAGRVLTLDTEGPSLTDETKTSPYREQIEIVSDDHRIFRSMAPAEGDDWHEFMTAHYRRVE